MMHLDLLYTDLEKEEALLSLSYAYRLDPETIVNTIFIRVALTNDGKEDVVECTQLDFDLKKALCLETNKDRYKLYSSFDRAQQKVFLTFFLTKFDQRPKKQCNNV